MRKRLPRIRPESPNFERRGTPLWMCVGAVWGPGARPRGGCADHLPGTWAALTAQGSSPGSLPPMSEVLWEQDQVTEGLARSQTGAGVLVTDTGVQPALGQVTCPASLLMARRDPLTGKFLPEVGSVLLLSCTPMAPLQLWTEPLCRAAPCPVSGHPLLAPLPRGPPSTFCRLACSACCK